MPTQPILAADRPTRAHGAPGLPLCRTLAFALPFLVLGLGGAALAQTSAARPAAAASAAAPGTGTGTGASSNRRGSGSGAEDARRSSGGVSSSAAMRSVATSLMSASWSTNHGSMAVASKTSSGVAPARMASMTTLSRPSCGCRAASSSASLSSSTHSLAQSNSAPGRSSERSAFWSASVKLRPMAMASPTDFMCVVSVGSAAGNFSNAKRGTLTTT